jgi:alkaline phosphatase D
MQRRDFLADIAAYSVLCAGVPNNWRVTTAPRLADDPFTLGVASGDPTPNGAVIWTRLSPKLYEPDGGMLGEKVTMNWEVADDEKFANVAQRGRVTVVPELGYSAHVDVTGLAPDRWYFYRFTLVAGSSPVGRLRTTPADGALTPLAFAFVSCQHYETGYYTAYDHLAREGKLDLVAHLGDYIYEYGPMDGRPRRHATTECRTLDQYRWRYAQTKSDKMLQAAHHAVPWVLTWDDHEVDNNYAGLVGENVMESEEQMHLRRAAAYQAWWEHQPVRVPRAKSWGDLNIVRTMQWGTLAKFFVLDTRQYRTDQPCGDGTKDVPCGDWGNPEHTMMGPVQEKWLDDGLAASKSRWQVLANQTRIAPWDNKPGPGQSLSMDQWGGYPAALARLMKSIGTRAPNRTVAITGDVHSNWVNELRANYDKPDAKKIGVEFVGTSISSDGDGQDTFGNWNDRSRAENPHVLWHNARRGYVMNAVGPAEWKATYRVVPFVSRPDAPIQTAAEFVTRNGKPGVEKV